MTRDDLLALLLELADLVRESLQRSPTVRLMLPRRIREIVEELERHVENT